jgi:hypothetical protein
LRHIYQRCESDCFPTCLAMISGWSHRQAIEYVHPFRKKGQPYTTYDHQIVRSLRALGYKVRKRYVKDFTKLKNTAILSLQCPGEKSGHVAVWDPIRRKVLEPHRDYRYYPISEYKKQLEFVWIITGGG